VLWVLWGVWRPSASDHIPTEQTLLRLSVEVSFRVAFFVHFCVVRLANKVIRRASLLSWVCSYSVLLTVVVSICMWFLWRGVGRCSAAGFYIGRIVALVMKAVKNQRSWAPDFLGNASNAGVITLRAVGLLVVSILQTIAVIVCRLLVSMIRWRFRCWISSTGADKARTEAFARLPVKHQTRWALPIGWFSSGAADVPGAAGFTGVVIVAVLFIPAFESEWGDFGLVMRVRSISGGRVSSTPFHILRLQTRVRDDIIDKIILAPASCRNASCAAEVEFRAGLMRVFIVSIIFAIAVEIVSRVDRLFRRRFGFRCGVASAVFNVLRCQTVPRIGVELEGAWALTVHWFLAHTAHILRTAVLVRVFVVSVGQIPAIEFVRSVGVRGWRGGSSFGVISSAPGNVVWVAALSCGLVECQASLTIT